MGKVKIHAFSPVAAGRFLRRLTADKRRPQLAEVGWLGWVYNWWLMKVQFEATFDDFVDATLRAVDRSKVVKLSRWGCAFVSGVVAGFLLYALIPDSPEVKLAFAIFGAVGGFVAYGLLYNPMRERRVRNYLRQWLPEDGPCPIVVELSPAGVSVSQLRNEIKYG